MTNEPDMSDDLAKKLLSAIEKNNELNEALLREMRRNNDYVVNYTEAGKIVGRTRQTISEYVASGKLHAVVQGGVKGVLVSELNNIKKNS